MRRVLVTLLLCNAAVALGGTVQVGDHAVAVGPDFETKQLGTIGRLRCYASKDLATNAPCTVVTGMFLPSFDMRDHAVEISIVLYNLSIHARRVWTVGTFTAVLQRPAKGKPTKFIAVGPTTCKTIENMNPIFDNNPLTVTHVASFKIVPAAEFKPPGKQE